VIEEKILTRRTLIEKSPLRIIIVFDWTDEFKKWHKENKIKDWWYKDFEGYKFDVKHHDLDEPFFVITKGGKLNYYIHTRVCKILSGFK